MAAAERGPAPEQDATPPPYARAARFGGERLAGRAYVQVQHLVHDADCDLSVYRFQLQGGFHVAVLGAPPPAELGRQVEALLALGQPVPLPPDLVRFLLERRAQATRIGPWVERHWRPGRPG